jgi:hypothetical protein
VTARQRGADVGFERHRNRRLPHLPEKEVPRRRKLIGARKKRYVPAYDDLALIRLALGDRVGALQRLRELAYGDCVKGIHNPRLGRIID